MSSERDKRASKTFSNRITSIFGGQFQNGQPQMTTGPIQQGIDIRGVPSQVVGLPPDGAARGQRIPVKEDLPRKEDLLVGEKQKAQRLRRKPPPAMEDGSNTETKRELNKLPPIESIKPTKYDPLRAVEKDLSDVIDTLQNELGNYMGHESALTSLKDDSRELGPKGATLAPEMPLQLTKSAHSGNSEYFTDCSDSTFPKDLSQGDSPKVPYPIDSPELRSTSLSNVNSHSSSEQRKNVSMPINNRSRTSITSSYSQSDGDVESEKILRHVESGSSPVKTKLRSAFRGPNFLDNSVNSVKNAPTAFMRSPSQNSVSLPPVMTSQVSVPLDNILNHSDSMKFKKTVPSARPEYLHKKSNSITSLWSMNSNRSVNLAALKKTLALKPGEGEPSTYVSTLRRSAGTAYNDSPPGKWKLPLGISPIDKHASYLSSNGRYMRLAGGLSQAKNKKTSGVGLKHGHLQPRLLAAEVDDNENVLGMNSALGKAGTSSTLGSISKTHVTNFKSSMSTFSSSPSLANSTMTSNSNKDLDSQSIQTGKDSTSTAQSEHRNSMDSSSSSSSLSISNLNVTGYYQHPNYAYSIDDDDTEVDSVTRNNSYKNNIENPDLSNNNNDDDDYRPRLVLMNPDNSDSD